MTEVIFYFADQTKHNFFLKFYIPVFLQILFHLNEPCLHFVEIIIFQIINVSKI